jgi:DNA modification methylase
VTSWRIIEGDCVETMRAMPEASVDAVVCDPPYGLEFMGKDWDAFKPAGARFRSATSVDNARDGIGRGKMPDAYAAGQPFQAWCEAWATEALRVLKPGGHLLAFGGTRTYHRLTCAIEDAGFEIRDCLAWLYGSGFPKSLDVSKAIDKAAGAEREVVGRKSDPRYASPATAASGSPLGNISPRVNAPTNYERAGNLTAPATPDAEYWEGWGTALKPAHEPIVLARKPLAGTVAGNVLTHGTGALNVDATRIGTESTARKRTPDDFGMVNDDGWQPTPGVNGSDNGRWPANVILDPEAAALLDEQTGESTSRIGQPRGAESGDGWGMTATGAEYADSGGASRFFYCPKADTTERNTGLDGYVPGNGKMCSCPDRATKTAHPPQRDTGAVTVPDDSDSSTTGSGNRQTGLFPTDSKSTTSTRTGQTIGSTTSSSSAPSTTSASTPPTTAALTLASGSDAAESAPSSSQPTASTTTSARKDGPSTDDAGPATSPKSSRTSSGADSNVCPDCEGVIRGAGRNPHPLEPTVKPVALMRWLCRLVTPPGGTILDPFTGSGTTGIAALREGFAFVGIEREAEYASIARARIIGDAPLINGATELAA